MGELPQSYSHIVDKIEQRLAGCQASRLLLAERGILIHSVQSVTSTFPNFIIQMPKRPNGLCDDVDKKKKGHCYEDRRMNNARHLLLVRIGFAL